MRITNRTLKRLLVLAGLVLLCGGLTASSCVKDRHIDVVASGEVIAPFVAHGSDNTWNDTTDPIDLTSEISSILNENDFEPDSVHASLESVSFRVTEPDPETSRTITGTIHVSWQGHASGVLVQLTSVLVDDPVNENWVPVALTQEGTDVINEALAAAISGTPVSLTFSTVGTSTPVDVPTLFTWEAKVKMNIVGTKKITVFEPL